MKYDRKEQEQILKRLKRGEFKQQYLIYARKSTDEAENQKNSLCFQSSENTRFAKQNAFEIAPINLQGFCVNGVISEKHSGFKETDELQISSSGFVQYHIDRPKFQQLLRHLNERHFRGVICLSWDRISRNRGDDTIIRKLMRQGVDVQFAFASYDDSSAGELHMDIDGMFAQHHSRVTSEKVRLATKAKRAAGKCTSRAPVGYLNEGTVDEKPLDPERAPMIREMFELYATGDWSLSDLVRQFNKQGFTMPPMRPRRSKEEMLADDDEKSKLKPKVCRPLSTHRLSVILRNPFYLGKIIGPEGIYIPSTCHVALIDQDLFDRVQIQLKFRTLSRYNPKQAEHPFRGFARCAQCKRSYTPYVKKGIQYFATHCVKDCGNTLRNCNLSKIEKVICDRLKELVFTDEELEMLDAKASTKIALLEEKRRKEETVRQREQARIKDELAYLRSNQLSLLNSGLYDPKSIQVERAKLEGKLDELIQSEAISEEAARDLVKDVQRISELLKGLIALYERGSSNEKERIVKILFRELLIDQNTAKLSPRLGLDSLFRRNLSDCAQSEWFYELFREGKTICEARSRLEELLYG